MSLAGWTIFDKEYFGGAWTAPDRGTVDMRGALAARNVRYFLKSVATRYGWGIAFSLSSVGAFANAQGPYNWLSELGNFLVWKWSDAGAHPCRISLVNISANPPALINVVDLAQGVSIPSFAQLGPRLYVTTWIRSLSFPSSAGNGVGCITSSNSGASFNYDQIIPGPVAPAFIPGGTISETGAGTVTAGIHNLGIRMLHRSGFLGRPGPDSSTSANPTTTTFAPQTFTSTGGQNLKWNFTPTANWPADVVQVQVVMSPVQNPNRIFLVPGAVQNVTGGSNTAVNITFSIDDDTLIASAAQLECTTSLDLLTASATGNAFLQPAAVVVIGSRLYYLATLPDGNGNTFSVVFASDPGQYQNITADQHVIQLPGQLNISAVFGVNGVSYLAGPHSTFYTQDNGGVPATWATPQIADGRKGPPYPNCVEVSTSGTYAWIADETGLYYFDGTYQTLPISYLQSDIWQTIELSTDGFSIKDDPLHHRVMVHAFGLSSGTPGQLFIWDYTNGTDPYSARFAQEDLPQALGGANTLGIEIVHNTLATTPSANQQNPELWFAGASTVGNQMIFWREKNPAFDNFVYRDEGFSNLAINAQYITNIMPALMGTILQPGSVGQEGIFAHHAGFFRITGNGNITLQVQSYDSLTSANLSPTLALTSAPTGKSLVYGELLGANGFVYGISQNVLDGFFVLSAISMYYTKYASHGA